MKFITVTDEDNRILYINADKIVTIRKTEDNLTSIGVLGLKPFSITESVEEVLSRLDADIYPKDEPVEECEWIVERATPTPGYWAYASCWKQSPHNEGRIFIGQDVDTVEKLEATHEGKPCLICGKPVHILNLENVRDC